MRCHSPNRNKNELHAPTMQSGQLEFRSFAVKLKAWQPGIVATFEHNGLDEYAANTNVEWTRLGFGRPEEERHQIQFGKIFQQKGKGENHMPTRWPF